MEFSKIKDRNLLASVSLFRELYNSEEERSLTDIIFKFIVGVVVLDGSYQLNITEIKNLLEKHYGFNILDSVIKNTLRTKSKTTPGIRTDRGVYLFDKSISNDFIDINSDIEKIEKNQNKIINSLTTFIESKLKKELDIRDKENVIQSLISFLLDNSYTNGYTDLISAFIISNENDYFTNSLNQIKEGVILYQGLSYDEPSDNHQKVWKDNLTLYLSTENLFNCLGYNGEFYKNIFNDFYNLIEEVNTNKKNTGKIQLCFFEETKDEINTFFDNAERILQGKMRLDYSVAAMKNILTGCNTIKDIKDKNIIFFSELKKKGIKECPKQYNYLDEVEYNVVDENIAKELAAEANNNGKNFDENECYKYMNLFTKINILRRGQSSRKFENIRYLYITENSFVKYLGHNNKVKFSDTDTSFAKDLDFVITKLWFMLNKGFSSGDLPKSFNVITKAKMMISSHLKSKVAKAYDKISKDVEDGRLTKELAIEYNHEYRKKSIEPEDIRINNIGESLDFILSEDDYELFLREKSKSKHDLEESQKENIKLKEELELLKWEREQEREEKRIKEEKETQERIAKMQLEKEKIKQEKLKIAKEQYADKMWRVEKKTGWKNLLILIVFFICSLIVIFLTILATNEKLQNKCIALFFTDENVINDNYLWIVILVATIIFIFEIVLFFIKKSKIMEGFKWFRHLFDKDYKNLQKELYRNQYTPDI